LPTALPRRRRVKAKQSFVSILFNTFLVVSALALTFVVLVREERYAFAKLEAATVEQAAPKGPLELTGESMLLPPD
jgi:hypothetical protein